MSISPNELKQDAAAQVEHQQKLTLDEVVGICEEMERLDTEVADLNAQAAQRQDRINELSTKVLPEALTALKLTGIDLQDGSRVELTEIIRPTINDENREAAHRWLRDNGFGDLIKNEVNVVFGKGEDLDAETLRKIIEDMRADGKLHCGSVEQTERVHPQTLTAQIKAWLRSGSPVPLDTFKVYIGQLAQLKRPKKKKGE